MDTHGHAVAQTVYRLTRCGLGTGAVRLVAIICREAGHQGAVGRIRHTVPPIKIKRLLVLPTAQAQQDEQRQPTQAAPPVTIVADPGIGRRQIFWQLVAVKDGEPDVPVLLAEGFQAAGETPAAVVVSARRQFGVVLVRQGDKDGIRWTAALNVFQDGIEFFVQPVHRFNPGQFPGVVQFAAGVDFPLGQMMPAGQHAEQQGKLTAAAVEGPNVVDFAGDFQLPRRWFVKQNFRQTRSLSPVIHQAQIGFFRLDACRVIAIVKKRVQAVVQRRFATRRAVILLGKFRHAGTTPGNDTRLEKGFVRPSVSDERGENFHTLCPFPHITPGW